MSKQCTLLRSLYYLEFVFNVAEGLSAIRGGRVHVNGEVQKDPQFTVKEGDAVEYAVGSRKGFTRTYHDYSEQAISEMLQMNGLIPTLIALQNSIARMRTQDVPLYREVDYPASPSGEEMSDDQIRSVLADLVRIDAEIKEICQTK